MKPIAFLANQNTVGKKVVITFSSPPTTVDITNAFYRYDKEFAITTRFDDGYLDGYQCAFKLFGGGNAIHQDGVDSDLPGLFYTDNCGNDVKFTSSVAINSANIDPLPTPTAIMNYNMVKELYVNKWGIWNTGQNDFGGDGEFEALADDAARYQKALDEIDGGFDDIKAATSIKVTNFTAPYNSDFYDGPSYLRFLEGKLKLVNNIDNITNTDLLNNGAEGTTADSKSWEDWLLNPFIGARYSYAEAADNNITRVTNTDTEFIATQVAKASSSYHPILALGSHRTGLSETYNGALPGGSIDPNFSEIYASFRYLSFKWFYEEVALRWGKEGTDQIIFVPMDDIYNYSMTKEKTVLKTVIVGNTVEISCDFSNVDIDYREHSLSLLVNADADITGISYVGFGDTSHNIGYSGGINTALINTSYAPTYDSAVVERSTANVLVAQAEKSQVAGDFTLAQDFVTSLRNGSFKTDLQVRLDAITVIPDSTIMQIDFGRGDSGYIAPYPWNTFGESTTGVIVGSKLTGLSSTSGAVTGIDLEVTAPFEKYESNFPSDPGDLPYPYEVCRDVYRVTGNTVAIMRFSGLDMGKLYDFKFYAHRGFVGNVSEYTVKGTTITLAHKDNYYDTVDILDVTPDVGGFIDVDINGDGSNPGYIGMLQLTEKLN